MTITCPNYLCDGLRHLPQSDDGDNQYSGQNANENSNLPRQQRQNCKPKQKDIP